MYQGLGVIANEKRLSLLVDYQTEFAPKKKNSESFVIK